MSRSTLERPDRRQQRAMALVGQILRIVESTMHPEVDPRRMRDQLMELLMGEGVDLLTDFTRSEIGVPPRDGQGWTITEILALEMVRLEAMTRPFPQFVSVPSHRYSMRTSLSARARLTRLT